MNADEPHVPPPAEPAVETALPEAEVPAERAPGTELEPEAGGSTADAPPPSDSVTAMADRSGGRVDGAPEADTVGSADAVARYNAKLLDMARANVAAASAHASALAQAKSIPEAMAINADHIRRQIESLTEQGRELTVLGQRVALEAWQPLRNALQRR